MNDYLYKTPNLEILMKFMFAIAPWDMWEGEDDTLYPLGLAYLGAVLEKNNYKTDILNLTYSKWEEVMENAREKIKSEKPDVFGISILSNSRISALKLTKMVKEVSPNTTIIAGGVHTTCLYDQVLNNYPIDYTVIGEGEITFIELLNAIKQKKQISVFKKINGIAFKYNGKILKTPPRERIRNLDSLPFPKHEFFDRIIKKYKFAQIMSSRGCPFNCAFCPSSVHWGRFMIQRSAKNVLKEMKYLVKKYPYINYIAFTDDEFICNNKRIIDLCKMILKDKLKIKWKCLGRVSSLNDELVSWMKKAGCMEIIFGVESGSQRILDNIGKKVKVSQIINAFKVCKKYNIKTAFLSIVGLPGENSKSAMETAILAKKLRVPTEPAILIVFPGTEVYRLAKEKGLMTDNYWLSEGLCPLYTAEHPKWRLWWWSFKTGFITNFYADDGDFSGFIKRKLINKINPNNFLRIFKRYISDKT